MRLHTLGEFVTLIGAAEALGTTREAIYRRVRRHHVPTSRVGRTLMIRVTDLELLERRRG